LEEVQEKKITEGQELILSNILYGYFKVVSSFKRIKELAANSVRPVWALLERNPKLSVEKLKYE
jgi:hypothetical protein